MTNTTQSILNNLTRLSTVTGFRSYIFYSFGDANVYRGDQINFPKFSSILDTMNKVNLVSEIQFWDTN